MQLNPEDEITGGEDLINLADVRARIAVLRPFHVEDTRTPETQALVSLADFPDPGEAHAYILKQDADTRLHLETVEYSDELEELTALRELEAEMAPLGERASAIHEGYLETFARTEIDDIVGELDRIEFYVDWKRLAEDRAADMEKTSYRGATYYLEA